jgi:hypothetical protein
MLGAALALGTAAALLLRLGARLWRASTPGSPERWLAVGFAALGLGAPPRLAAAHLLSAGDAGALAVVLNAASHAVLEVAIVALALFVRRVFRSESSAAGAFVALVAATSGGLTLWLVVTTHVDQEASALALALNLSRAVPVLWAFAECAHYARLMRRRLALGLADPLVANRFVLWSIWTGALSFAALAMLAVRGYAHWLTLTGLDPRTVMPAAVPATATVVAAAVACAGIAIALAFFPSQAYARWITSRSGT